ncbi:MAG: metallophosphoesterase [Candidatus Lokiarchaeota archaeon]|nr:metallophosphoesterase [Candidatus Lokiarchaeota archaeon]
MKFVCMADTHELHHHFKVPKGDVYINAGDFTNLGEKRAISSFNEHLASLSHDYKIVIAGNHDMMFEKNPKLAKSLLKNCIYLENTSIEIEGIKIYGSPHTPWFYDWAFNLQRGKPLQEKWALIPEDTDILITHGPPLGHGDFVKNSSEGCEDLLHRIQEIKPKFHIFGHIHEGYGITKEGKTTCINASSVDENYKPNNEPFIFEF